MHVKQICLVSIVAEVIFLVKIRSDVDNVIARHGKLDLDALVGSVQFQYAT